MDWTIALNKDNNTLTPDGTRANSKPIYIPPGKVALISMFNMVTTYTLVDINGNPVPAVNPDGTYNQQATLYSDDCAIILKLSVGPIERDLLKDICACDTPNLGSLTQRMMDSRVITSEPVFQSTKEWGLTPCNNFALIPTPGLYMIQLLDPDQLDVAFIEYALLDVQDAAIIPDAFKLGSNRGVACGGTP